MEQKKIADGTRVFSVSTGRVDVFFKKSREAAEYVVKRPGFIGVHPTEDGNYTLWLFDTVNNAIGAKNLMKFRGIQVGNNICEFEIKDEGQTIEFVGVAAGKDKGKGYVVN